ncbi:unnamed protein product [Bathycoccus prasinos]
MDCILFLFVCVFEVILGRKCAPHMNLAASTKSLALFTTSFSISPAYGTGASSMHKRITGASNSSNKFSETMADNVAPTPPVRVLSSKIINLCVRSREDWMVLQSTGFMHVISMKSNSMPLAANSFMASSDSLTPCKYVTTVIALFALTAASEAFACCVDLCNGKNWFGLHGPLVFIIFTGNNKTPGPLSRIIDFAKPYASFGLLAEQIFKPGMPMMYAWNGCECSAPSDWFGAVPPAPMTVIGILNCPPVVAYVFPAEESSAMPYIPKFAFINSTIGLYPFMASPKALPMK